MILAWQWILRSPFKLGLAAQLLIFTWGLIFFAWPAYSASPLTAMKAAVHAAGYVLQYDAKSKSFTIHALGNTARLWAGSKTMELNGKKQMLAQSPLLKKGTGYLPEAVLAGLIKQLSVPKPLKPETGAAGNDRSATKSTAIKRQDDNMQAGQLTVAGRVAVSEKIHLNAETAPKALSSRFLNTSVDYNPLVTNVVVTVSNDVFQVSCTHGQITKQLHYDGQSRHSAGFSGIAKGTDLLIRLIDENGNELERKSVIVE